MKTSILAFALLTSPTLTCGIHAQEVEDFNKLVRKSMSHYEDTLKSAPGYDSVAWHGGVYLGSNTRGVVLPNGFFRYQKGRWNVTGDVQIDLSDIQTTQEEDGRFETGAHNVTDTDIDSRHEYEDLKMRIDYRLTHKDVLSLDIFQKYHHDLICQNSIKSGIRPDGTSTESKYEEQERKVRDFNCGVLVEHKHTFKDAGSLSSRIYYKYDNKPTDVNREDWGELSESVMVFDTQRYTSSEPKAQIIYLSPKWNGFNLGVRQKVGFMNMHIDDSATSFGYEVDQSLSSFDLTYKPGPVTLNFQAAYEIYHHNIVDHVSDDISHTYRDWLFHASVAWKINKTHRLALHFDHDYTRPTYTQLYPFIHVGSYLGARVVGNSSLQPSLINQYQAQYTFKSKPLTLKAIVTYKRTSDDITSITGYDGFTQQTVKTWVNDATYNTIQLAVEGEVRKGCFDMTMGIRAQHLDYIGMHVSTDEVWSYSFKMRPKFRLPNGWTLAAVFLHNGRETHRHWYNQAFTYMALRGQKQLGDWAIYCYIQDLLRETHVKVQHNTGYTVNTSNDYNARALIMGCSYSF